MKKTVIVIAGPTAAGKTAVGTKIAQLLNGEIISADSRQVYRLLNIGTNKEGEWDPDREARLIDNVPQLGTDIIDPCDVFTAGTFVRYAEAYIAQIRNKGKIPIIVGGTGMYIKALIDGLAPLPEGDAVIRQELQEHIAIHGLDSLYQQLYMIDPIAADKNRKNPQRLIRAMEVFRLTGTPISELQKNVRVSTEDFVQFGITMPKELLHDRINERSRKMLESGMITETTAVLDAGYDQNCPGLQSIGYRSIIEYLIKKMTLQEVEASLSLDTRHYAKRQMTWFNRDKRIQWINAADAHFNVQLLSEMIVKLLQNLI
jgi:tRNA dimethylallyltransferase